MKISVTFIINAPDTTTAAELDSCLGPAAENFRKAMAPVGEVSVLSRRGTVPPHTKRKRLELGDDDLDT